MWSSWLITIVIDMSEEIWNLAIFISIVINKRCEHCHQQLSGMWMMQFVGWTFGICYEHCHQQCHQQFSSTMSSKVSSAIFINNCHEHEWGNLLVGHLARAGSDWCPVPHTEMASAVAFKMVGWKKGMNIKMRWWSISVDDRFELVINTFIVSSPPDEEALSLKACGNILFKFQM